ncbi:MAG: hypothetical protein EBS55_10475 [Flavobacteriaceae bacterium]|nr:hypothetical protein [Flavobacteriaceae bacterium]
MEIKISEDKLERIIDIIVNGIGVDKGESFQSRLGSKFEYIEFLTPRTRLETISRYYPDLNLVAVNDEKLYDLISVWVGSPKLYNTIKDEIIKRIYKKYTNRYRRMSEYEIRNVKYMSDEQFNKK